MPVKAELRDFLFSNNKKMAEIENGCLGDGYKQTDFLLCGEDMYKLPKLYKKNNIRFYYNQSKQAWSKKSCTIFWAWGAIADTVDYDIPLEIFKEVDDESYNHGRVKDAWRYVSLAVDLRRKRRNSDKELVSKYWKLASYAIEMKDDLTVANAIWMLYNIISWFYGNYQWTKDYSDDWKLDWIDFGASTYWHCINVICNDNKPFVKDNYAGRIYNEYELGHFPSKIKNRHNMGYVFTLVKEDNYERLKDIMRMKTLINNIKSENSELWNLTQSENKKNLVHEFSDELRKREEEIKKEEEKLS